MKNITHQNNLHVAIKQPEQNLNRQNKSITKNRLEHFHVEINAEEFHINADMISKCRINC